MKTKTLAAILSCISAALIVAGFLIPPMGVIDNSVFIAVGELMGIKALFMVWDTIDKGIEARFTHGNTTVTFNEHDDTPDQPAPGPPTGGLAE